MEEEERRRRMEEEERRRRIEEERLRMESENCSSRIERGMRNKIDELAIRVIRGEFGNGPTRRIKLGNLYPLVQNRVNERLGKSKKNNKIDNSLDNNMGNTMKSNMMNNNIPIQNANKSVNFNNNESSSSELKESEINNIKEEDKINKIDLNAKEDIMKIINTQDFVEGFWKINEYTEIIKEKYKKEYDLLKEKNIYINDKVAITILIIYFINKEHPELLEELLMIIRKAKIFIMNETKDTYENIAKEILIIKK